MTQPITTRNGNRTPGRPTPVSQAADTGETLTYVDPLLSPVSAHHMPSAYNAGSAVLTGEPPTVF